jgi:hypothetical protein
MPKSGYVCCDCRDCFLTAIADDMSKGAMCGDCLEAGCEPNSDCQADGAYDGAELNESSGSD